jgi:N-formylglutamate amidohydrolase
MILHIPHSGSFTSNLKVSQKSLNLLRDHFTDDLFNHGYESVVCSNDRHYVDCERLWADPMGYSHGMGIIYVNDIFGDEIDRSLLSGDYDEPMKIYSEHHHKLKALVNKSLAYLPYCVLVDCHSFGEDQLKTMSLPYNDLPDICIGANIDGSTPNGLVDLVADSFEKMGYTVKVNYPFSGSILPTVGCYSIMIEINKSLYMKLSDDYLTVTNIESYDKVKRDIGNVLKVIEKWEDSLNKV